MSTFSAFPFRRALKALAPVVLIATAWFAQHQAIAATENLYASPCFEDTARLTGSPPDAVFVRPGADYCISTYKSSTPVAKARKQTVAAVADFDMPAGVPTFLTATDGFDLKAGQKRQGLASERGSETGYPAAFQSRGPPTTARY